MQPLQVSSVFACANMVRFCIIKYCVISISKSPHCHDPGFFHLFLSISGQFFRRVHILIICHLSNISQLNVSLKDQEFLRWLSVMKVCYNTMC